MSKSMKNSVKKRSKSCPDESLDSLNCDTQLSSDQTKDISELNADLNKRFETSLCISKPEKNSTEWELHEQIYIPQASVLLESTSKILNRRPSLLDTLYRPFESSPSSCNKPSSIKTDDKKTSSSSENSVNLKQDVGKKQPPFCHSGNSAGYFSRSLNIQYSEGSYSNKNCTHLHKSFNDEQNQSCTNTEQYPEQSLMRPNFINKPKTDENFYQVQTTIPALKESNTVKSQFSIHSHQQQFQQPHIKRTELPFILSQNIRPCNPLPPIRTNDIPMSYGQYQTYFKSPMPPFNTNAVPMRYLRPTSPYRNQKSSIKHRESHCTSDAIQNILNEAAELAVSIYKSSIRQPCKYTDKETDDPNIIDLNFKQSKIIEAKKELTKTDKTDLTIKDLTENEGFNKTEFTKIEIGNIIKRKVQPTNRTDCPNKNILNVDVPNELPVASLFPLRSNIQRRIGFLPFQLAPIQFPTPFSMDYSVFTSPAEREINSHRAYRHLGTSANLNSSDPACIYPLITEQPTPRLTIPDNTLNQAGLNAGNPIQHPIQATCEKSFGVQFQHIQNETAYPQYQYFMSLIYRKRRQCQPFFQLVPVVQTFENVNPAMNQYQLYVQNTIATQYQNVCQNMQNATAAPNYHDPNLLAYPYGIQFQSLRPYPNIHSYQYQQIMPNIIAAAQYQNPYHALSPHGIGNSSFSFKGQPNFSSNISRRQIYKENPSLINMSHYPSWPYITSGTSYICTNEPYQTSYPIYGYVPFNIPQIMGPFRYPAWSTNDDS